MLVNAQADARGLAVRDGPKTKLTPNRKQEISTCHQHKASLIESNNETGNRMAKHKTSELTGDLLDAAVAKAEGIEYQMHPKGHMKAGVSRVNTDPRWFDQDIEESPYLKFSTDWGQGGPIIERERIHINPLHVADEVSVEWNGFISRRAQSGSTPLIAAMRAYVASKMGEEVDL